MNIFFRLYYYQTNNDCSRLQLSSFIQQTCDLHRSRPHTLGNVSASPKVSVGGVRVPRSANLVTDFRFQVRNLAMFPSVGRTLPIKIKNSAQKAAKRGANPPFSNKLKSSMNSMRITPPATIRQTTGPWPNMILMSFYFRLRREYIISMACVHVLMI